MKFLKIAGVAMAVIIALAILYCFLAKDEQICLLKNTPHGAHGNLPEKVDSKKIQEVLPKDK